MTGQEGSINARRQRGAHRGQMLVIFALSITVMLGAVMLGIDIAHLRTETERAQQAANAAALAGVVFMPNYLQQAEYRATEEAIKNGFVTNATQGISVTPAPVSGYNYRLRVTISEPVPLFFGGLVGHGAERISVSATSEFLPPIRMGSPDYVLGFPRFPSYLTPAVGTANRAPQNFYLNQNGPYTLKEMGDPYDPYFESLSNSSSPFGTYGATVAMNFNPCASGNTCPGTGVIPNQLANSGSNFGGYKYLITVPANATVLVKLFDPFDEQNYNLIAHCWDQGYSIPSSQTQAQAYNGSCMGTSSAHATAKLAPQDILPKYTDTQGCILGMDPNNNNNCLSENVDLNLPTNFGQMIQTSGYPSGPSGYGYFGYQPASGGTYGFGPDSRVTTTPGNTPLTQLEFSLTGPVSSTLDPTLNTRSISMTPSMASSLKCPLAGENCVIQAPFDTGEDPALSSCYQTGCQASKVAFKFVNYAILHGLTTGPAYYQLVVKSVEASPFGSLDPFAQFGEGSNAYGLAVCDATRDNTYTPANVAPLGTANANGYTYVTADPISTTSTSGGWNPDSCPNPNPPPDPKQNVPDCTDPRLAAPGQCAQIAGEWLLPLYNLVTGGSSLIPLGYIPPDPDYAGKTISIDLYDPGDIFTAPSDTLQHIFKCLLPTSSTSGSTPANSMEVLTPAGDLQCTGFDTSTNHIDGHTNIAGTPPLTNTQCGSLSYNYSTSRDYDPSNYTSAGPAPAVANQPLDVGSTSSNNSRHFNGSWVHIKIGIPSNYAQMVNGNTGQNNGFGGYWKVLYRIGGNSDDITTWAMTIEGSAVHLVTDASVGPPTPTPQSGGGSTPSC